MKPYKYAHMGVEEYFLYDPEMPMNMKYQGRRLVGWRLNKAARTLDEMQPDQEERLWSQQLGSFLVPDDMYLCLYDPDGQRRLTEAEARQQNERLCKQQARLFERRARLLAEKLRALGVNPDEL